MAVNINVPSQVRTFANLAAFPASGALKTIYIAEDTNKTYRWTGSVYVEVSAAGASGITIGTTAITSGTVGRVLFEGTGNVVQESANLFWDNTNNRLGIGTSSPTTSLMMQQNGGGFIRMVRNLSTTEFTLGITNVRLGAGSAGGVFTANNYEFRDSAGTAAFLNINNGNVLINTTTDAGFRLDVNGTARVSGPTFAVGDWTNRSTSVYVRAATGGSELRGFLIGYGASNDGNAGSFTYNPTGNLLNIRSPYNSGTVALSFEGNTNSTQFHNTSGIVHSKIVSGTGNWLINTTTDAGFKLDVNGTARVTGTGTSTTNSFVVQNSASVQTFRVNDLGQVQIGRTTAINWTFSSNSLTSSQYAFILSSNGSALSTSGNGGVLANDTGAKICDQGLGGANQLATAVLECNSTTRGFLPPRLTTTQKNAIASPATGLQIFDTTLNRPCFYDGTTWITL